MANIANKERLIAYRCTSCGSAVLGTVGKFALSADMLKLKCDCGQSEMTIVYSKDGKVRLTVPCIFCPKPHNYVVNSSIFFGKDLFVLPCAYSDMNIAMMGDVNMVKAELARTELELLEMLEESGVENLESLRSAEPSPEEVLTDPQIFDIIMFVINDLDAEGKIYCRCKNEGEGDFEVEVLADGIKVSCKKCGASRVIPTDGLLAANAFLNADSLYLE